MYSKIGQLDKNILIELLNQIKDILFDCDLIIDSRKVSNRSIFCAYPGSLSDGRNFIIDAANNGATAILYEDNGVNYKLKIPTYPIKNLVQYVGILALIKHTSLKSNGYKFLDIIAITGTNGKTSIAHWLNQVYMFLGKKTAIIGTTGAGVYPQVKDLNMTTPNPIILHELLNSFQEQSVQSVAIEVSSHALDQGRVNGVNFATAVFTNLTHDHLDYHTNIENYSRAKEKLFYWNGLKHAVINVDDSYGKILFDNLQNTEKQLRVLSYGIKAGELCAKNIIVTLEGVTFNLSYDNKEALVKSSVIGKINIYNLLALSGVLLVNGYGLEEIARAISQVTPVCGRMDKIIIPNKPIVVVDYAHTPDALENALTTLRNINSYEKLYCVFGCGGNRDKSKRQTMGYIAAKLSDYVIITSDNPRFESPDAIIQDILIGVNSVKNEASYIIEANREEAIIRAIREANLNDVILIAGKGHETYQSINGENHPFSDSDIAKRELKLK